jgi:TetR/AcrR family transcriptional regulator, cholesterol catabolism regulator
VTGSEAAGDAGRRERKSDKTRRRILDAAADVLNRKGFDGTRVADIATLAELAVPAVYYYFESREAILEEVVTLGGQRALENVRARIAALPDDASAMDRICAAFAGQLEMVLRESTYTAAAMRTLGQLPPDIRARQLHHQRVQGDLWRELVAAGVESGEIDPSLDPRAARMLLLGAVNWAPEWWDPARGSIDDVVVTTERLVRNALTGSAAPAPAPAQHPTPGMAPVFTPPPM